MRLYLAGADSAGDFDCLDGMENLSFLVSYFYILNGMGWDVIKFAEERNLHLFLDSGAFSAMTLGAKIEISDYIDFCREHGNRFDVIASLDVIGDWKNSDINHQRMHDAGINSIPCFHVREPFEYLEKLIQENDYIALGVAGMQRYQKKIMSWLTNAYYIRSSIKPSCRFHGFALTSPMVMKSFSWYSIDSSTWLNGRKYGKAFLLHGDKFVQVTRNSSPDMIFRVSNLIPKRNQTRKEYQKTLRNNAKVMFEWTQSLTRQRSKKYITSQDIL